MMRRGHAIEFDVAQRPAGLPNLVQTMSLSDDSISGPAAREGDVSARSVGIVSVLVVTHRDLALVERALDVFTATPGVEVVIVNNDPSQDVRGRVKGRLPDAAVIEMGFDAGYARAMNAGIAARSR